MAEKRTWGGVRPGAGRKPSAIRTAAAAKKLIERAKQADADTPLDALWRAATSFEFVNSYIEDPVEAFKFQMDCASRVCPYLFPRYSAVAVKNEEDQRLTIVFQEFKGNPLPRVGSSSQTSRAIEAAIDVALADDAEDDGASHH